MSSLIYIHIVSSLSLSLSISSREEEHQGGVKLLLRVRLHYRAQRRVAGLRHFGARSRQPLQRGQGVWPGHADNSYPAHAEGGGLRIDSVLELGRRTHPVLLLLRPALHERARCGAISPRPCPGQLDSLRPLRQRDAPAHSAARAQRAPRPWRTGSRKGGDPCPRAARGGGRLQVVQAPQQQQPSWKARHQLARAEQLSCTRSGAECRTNSRPSTNSFG